MKKETVASHARDLQSSASKKRDVKSQNSKARSNSHESDHFNEEEHQRKNPYIAVMKMDSALDSPIIEKYHSHINTTEPPRHASHNDNHAAYESSRNSKQRIDRHSSPNIFFEQKEVDQK